MYRALGRFSGFTVALIGGDGAGKTTVARRMLESPPVPMKYLYMGFSTQSSNIALPTSRLVLYLKRRCYQRSTRRSTGRSNEAVTAQIPANVLDYGTTKRNSIWLMVRLLNRLAEAAYRELVSLVHRIRGYVVVYDRHHLFDAASEVGSRKRKRRLNLKYAYYWVVRNFYPKPDLVIFLDAPGDVLYQRKHEASPEFLSRQGREFQLMEDLALRFVRVDATQPLDKVVEEVVRNIEEFAEDQSRGRL